MKNVGFFKVHADIGICVGRRIVLENQSGVVGTQRVVLPEDSGRDRTRGRCRESVLPTFDSRVF